MSVQEFDREQSNKETSVQEKKLWLNVINETVREFKEFILTTSNQFLHSIKSSIFRVELTNQKEVIFPETQKVEVTNNKEYPKEIKVSNLSDIKIPEPPKFPEFPKYPKFPDFPKYPDFPKSMEVSNMQAIVKEIKAIVDKIPKEVTVKRGFFDQTPKTVVKVDNSEITKRLEALQRAFESRPDPKYPETDFSEVVDAVDKVTHSLDTLEFPVPQVVSSWQHSLTMQAEDLACTYVWKMVGTKEVLDYKQFTGANGKTYRKTLTYNSNGKPTYQTEWEQQ